MRTEHNFFWWMVVARGLWAVFVGCAVFVLPDMMRPFLLMPIAMAAAIAWLAIYGIGDGLLVFASSFLHTSRVGGNALRLQALFATAIGLLLITALYNQVELKWFLSLASLQAFSFAFAELFVATHANNRRVSHWNYAGAVIAGVCGIAYAVARLFAAHLADWQITAMVFSFLLALGIAECATGLRMLYAERPPVVNANSLSSTAARPR